LFHFHSHQGSPNLYEATFYGLPEETFTWHNQNLKCKYVCDIFYSAAKSVTYRKIFYSTNIYRDITCVGVFAPWICKLLHFVDFVVPTVEQDHYRWANCKAKWSEIMKYFSGPVWLHCLISNPIKASRYLGMWLDLTTSHRQTWLFSCTATYHSTDLLTARGVAHLVVHGTTGSTSYEMIPHVRLETSGDVLSTVDMVVQRRDGPRWLREHDDDNDEVSKLSVSV